MNEDRDVLLTFYDFPAEHWKHLRTTNPIESTFATVRHRTSRSKGCLSNPLRALRSLSSSKLLEAVQKSWRRLDGNNKLPKSRCENSLMGFEVIAKTTNRQPSAVAA